MADDLQAIAANFDQRAARYAKSDWHRVYAEQFVALAPLEAGQRVLDAGAGTGFAALAIARRVGPAGRVLAVDVVGGHARRASCRGYRRGSVSSRRATGRRHSPRSTCHRILRRRPVFVSAALHVGAGCAARVASPSQAPWPRRLLDHVRRFATAGPDVSRLRHELRPDARGSQRCPWIGGALPERPARGRLQRHHSVAR